MHASPEKTHQETGPGQGVLVCSKGLEPGSSFWHQFGTSWSQQCSFS